MKTRQIQQRVEFGVFFCQIRLKFLKSQAKRQQINKIIIEEKRAKKRKTKKKRDIAFYIKKVEKKC
jgi:hypothetical protein